MSGFPGAIYDGWGESLDPTIPDLLQEHLEGYPYRSMVMDRLVAPVARIWLLANEATPNAIPPALMIEAVELVLAGESIVILAQRPEPEVDVREGLFHALDLYASVDELTGQA